MQKTFIIIIIKQLLNSRGLTTPQFLTSKYLKRLKFINYEKTI